MTDNTNTDAETLAEQVLTVKDWRRMEAEGLSASEYVEEQYGVDPAEYTNHHDLRVAALSANEDLDADTDEENVYAEAVGGNARIDGDSTEEIEALASQVLTVSDWREAERNDTSAREYVAETFGVDPREFREESELRKAISEAKRQ